MAFWPTIVFPTSIRRRSVNALSRWMRSLSAVMSVMESGCDCCVDRMKRVYICSGAEIPRRAQPFPTTIFVPSASVILAAVTLTSSETTRCSW